MDGPAIESVPINEFEAGSSDEVVAARSRSLVGIGRISVVVGTALLFYKLGGIAGPHRRLPQWKPWTWRIGPLFRTTLTTGGDTGAHVWAPWFVRRHLVQSLRLTGWSKDWYGGFPVLQFYFPAPTWTIVLLSALIPLNVAFKLVTVSGLFGLPFASMFLARSARLPKVYRYLFALGSFLFLFAGHFEILGGNIISTMAGEFSFSISLTIAVVFLGILLVVWRDGLWRRRGGVVLALMGLSHLLPTIFAAFSAVAILCTHINVAGRDGLTRKRPQKLRDVGVVVLIGAGLGAWWVLPFARTLAYSNDMGWEHTSTFFAGLVPGLSPTKLSDAPRTGVATITVALGLALLGAIVSVVRFSWPGSRWRNDETRLGVALTLMVLGAGAAFRFTPQFRLWNERALPFYYLSCYLLSAFGVVSVGRFARAARRLIGRNRRRTKPLVKPERITALALAGVVWISWWSIAGPLRLLPGWMPLPKWHGGHLSIQRASSSEEVSSVDDWPSYNYNGYEAQPDYKEFTAIMSEMARIGSRHGCGRALWDYEDELDRYGTSMGMMLLPYFTNGCISSMEGLYFESSASTPYHFLNAALLSSKPSNPQRSLPYATADVATGVRHLQQLGVRYYMAFSPSTVAQANANPDLTLVGASEYSRDCSDDEKATNSCPTRWQIYQVANSELVEGLPYQPGVVTGIGQGQTSGWLDVAIAQYERPEEFAVPLAADGPRAWPRVVAQVKTVPGDDTVGAGVSVENAAARVLAAVKVSDIVEGQGDIRFVVDRPGIPVVVKESYFPNWKVDGAEGPWRLAPNLMVVVPTRSDVHLFYGRTTTDWLGTTISASTALAAIGGWVLSRRRKVWLSRTVQSVRSSRVG